MSHKKRHNSGVSLTEVLLVMTILGLLVIVLLSFVTRYLGRARDAERKADLQEIKTSFEDYFNDNGCYPDPSVLDDCDGTSFRPYLSTIPCDPVSKRAYYYAPISGDQCAGYRVYTQLEDNSDPVIAELGCDTPIGCGPGITYNYGVSAGTSVYSDSVLAPSSSPAASSPPSSPSPSAPSPSGIIYEYACDSAGTCNRYEQGHPFLINCPITFEHTNCDNACGNPANRCNG